MLNTLHGPGARTFLETGHPLRVFVPWGAGRAVGIKHGKASGCVAASSGGEKDANYSIASSVPDVDKLLPILRRKTEERGAGQDAGPGCVYLVGTGPGDPGLLTMRAVQLMQSADVVLYDRLVSSDVLQWVHSAARMVYVGKRRGFHTRTQDQIHDLLIQFAEAGATVLRLKGGDPYVFGRGGEEMEFLEERGIPVYCVPGITAASGISAELGIPLTHRGVATTVRFLTGHSRSGGENELDETIELSVDPKATLVVYMGLQTLPCLTKRLLEAGQDPRTPSVAVERGTTKHQRIVFAHLAELSMATQEAELQSPTLIIIGDVVALAAGWKKWIETGVLIQSGTYHSFNQASLSLKSLKEGCTSRDVNTTVDQE